MREFLDSLRPEGLDTSDEMKGEGKQWAGSSGTPTEEGEEALLRTHTRGRALSSSFEAISSPPPAPPPTPTTFATGHRKGAPPVPPNTPQFNLASGSGRSGNSFSFNKRGAPPLQLAGEHGDDVLPDTPGSVTDNYPPDFVEWADLEEGNERERLPGRSVGRSLSVVSVETDIVEEDEEESVEELEKWKRWEPEVQSEGQNLTAIQEGGTPSPTPSSSPQKKAPDERR